jgi:hypothetical protein
MPLAGFRVFRPPVPARVEMREGRPVKVFFRAPGESFRRGEVVAASGPWRTSGEWWTKDAWQQDEWDLELLFADNPKTKNQHNYHFDESATVDDREPAFPPHAKSRFLFSRPASRKRDDQSHPAASLGMTASSGSAKDLKILRQTGRYRFAYDPARDIWLVRGMFD